MGVRKSRYIPKVVAMLVVVAMFMSMFSFNAPIVKAAYDGNLLNGDFEQIDENGKLVSWGTTISIFDGIANREVGLNTDKMYVRTGDNSLRFWDNVKDGAITITSNQIAVQPGKTYEGSVYNFNKGPDNPDLYLKFYDSSNIQVGSNYVVTNNGAKNMWNKIVITQKAPAGAAYATLQLNTTSTACAETYFDDVAFRQLSVYEESLLKYDANLFNGNFEQMSNGQLDGWGIASWTYPLQKVTLNTDKQYVHTGENSLKLWDNNKDGNIIINSNKIAVEPGKMYTASAYSFNKGPDNPDLYLKFYDSTGKQLIYKDPVINNKDLSYNVQNNGTKNQWNKIAISRRAPEGAEYAVLQLVTGKTTLHEAYFDDIWFGRTPEEVQNPSFEEVSTPKVDNWVVTAGGSVSSDPVTVRTGNNSLMVVDQSTSGAVNVVSSEISVTPGEIYEASAYAFTLGGTPDLYLKFFDGISSAPIGVKTFTASQVYTWEKLSARAIAPANSVYATITLNSNSTNAGVCYFDDVKLEKLNGNLINGEFEQPIDDNESWKTDIKDAALTSARTVTQAVYGSVYEGKFSMKLDDKSTTYAAAVVSNKISIDEGSVFEASVKVFNESGSSDLMLEYYDSYDILIGTFKTTEASINEWKTLTLRSEAPYKTSYALLRLSTSSEGTGISYFDNAEFNFISEIQVREFPLKEAGHPRLYFTANDIPALREKAADLKISPTGDSGNKLWQNIEKTAKEYLTEKSFTITYYGGYQITYELPVKQPAQLPQPPGYTSKDPYPYWVAMAEQIQKRLETLSLAYSITGDVQYGNLAKTYALEMANWSEWSASWVRPVGFYSMLETTHLTMGVTAAYDMVYELFTEAERKIIEDAIVTKALEPMYKDSKVKLDSNIQMLKATALGTGAAAVLGKAPDAEKYLTRATDYYKWYLDMRSYSGQQEGLFYTSYALEYMMKTMDHLARTTGQKDLINHPFVNDMLVNWVLYSLIPGGGGLVNFSDGSIGSYFHNTMSLAAKWFDNGYAGWYLANAKPIGSVLEKFIYFNPDLKVSDPNDLETSAVFDEIGWATLRTGWDKDDTLLAFISNNSRFSHNHYDQNSFILATNNSQIATDPGYKEFNAGAVRNFSEKFGHSTIHVDGEAQKVYGNSEMTKGLLSPYYDYVKGSAAKAYSFPSIDKFDRHIVNVKPGYYVMMDDLAADVARTWDWILYTGSPTEFEVDGNAVSVGESVYGNNLYGHKGGVQMAAKFLAPDTLPISVETYPGAEGYGPFVRVGNGAPSEQYRFLTILKTAPQVQKGEIKILDLGSPVDSSGKEYKTVNAVGTAAIFYRGDGPGDYVTFKFNVQRSGEYDVGVKFLKNISYGDFQVYIDGNRAGEVFEGYNPVVIAAPEHELGKIYLSEGDHEIKIEVVGKNEQSQNYYIGIDSIVLDSEENANEPDMTKVSIDADYLQADNVIGTAVRNGDYTDYVLFKTGTVGAYTVSGIESDSDQSVVSVGSKGNIGKYAMTRGTTLKYNGKELLSGSATFSAALGYDTVNMNMAADIDIESDGKIRLYTGLLTDIIIDGKMVKGLYDAASGITELTVTKGLHKIVFSLLISDDQSSIPVIIAPIVKNLDTVTKDLVNKVQNLDQKSTDQAVSDAVSLLKDVAGLKEEDKAKVTEKITILLEKTVEKLVKLDEKAMEKTETQGVVSVQIKLEAINKVLESLASLENGIKDSKLDKISLKKLVTVDIKDTVKDEIKVGIPVEAVRSMSEKGLDMSIQSGSISFKLPANAISPEQLAGAEAGTTVQVTSKEVKAEDADKLTDPATKDATENEKMNSASKVYKFNLDMVKGDQITNMAKFAQKVTVEIPYTGTVNAEKLGVYYYNPETKAWDYVGGKVNKETRKVEFKTGHFSVYAVMEYNRTFEDIKDHWAQSDVELMASKHIIKGKGGDTFAPESNITRAEFATIIIKALGMDMVKYKGSFKDVEEDSWYSDLVQTAADNGIIQGYEGKFRPEDTITREEMTVIMMRAHQLVTGLKVAAGDISQFSDKGTISSWAIKAVAEAKGLGLINGVSNSLFAPGDNATRAESAAIVKRLLDKLQ